MEEINLNLKEVKLKLECSFSGYDNSTKQDMVTKKRGKGGTSDRHPTGILQSAWEYRSGQWKQGWGIVLKSRLLATHRDQVLKNGKITRKKRCTKSLGVQKTKVSANE